MPAKSKIIDEKTYLPVTVPGVAGVESKEVPYSDVQTLVTEIKRRHTLINQETDLMEADKKTLGTISTEVFLQDLEKDTPEVLGNHEHHLGDQGTLTVNFKLKGRPLTEINKQPAAKVIKDLFKEHSDKLFSFDKSHAVQAEEGALRAQACEHPECFDITLKALTHEQKMRLVAEHPEWVTVSVTDINKYAELYPSHVVTTEAVNVNNGFIETVGTIEPTVLKSTRKFLSKLLKPMLTTAVNCGNKSKKK